MNYEALSEAAYTEEAFHSWWKVLSDEEKLVVAGLTGLDRIRTNKLINLCMSGMVSPGDLAGLGVDAEMLDAYIYQIAVKFYLTGTVSASGTTRSYLAARLSETLPVQVDSTETIQLPVATWNTMREYGSWKPMFSESDFPQMFDDRLLATIYEESGLAADGLLLSDVFGDPGTIWASESPSAKTAFQNAYTKIFGEYRPYLNTTTIWNLYYSSDTNLSPVNSNPAKTSNLLMFVFPTAMVDSAIGECAYIMQEQACDTIEENNAAYTAIVEQMINESFSMNHPNILNRFGLMAYVLGLANTEWITAWEKLKYRITVFQRIMEVLRNNLTILETS